MNNCHRRCLNNGCQRTDRCRGMDLCELNAEAFAPAGMPQAAGLSTPEVSEAEWQKYRRQRDDWAREQAAREAAGPRLADVASADFDAWCAGLWRLIDAYRRGEGWPVSCRDRIKAHLAKCPGRPAA